MGISTKKKTIFMGHTLIIIKLWCQNSSIHKYVHKQRALRLWIPSHVYFWTCAI